MDCSIVFMSCIGLMVVSFWEMKLIREITSFGVHICP
jgi:hypothetical protein